ncbi:DUF4188 domain-containing protein [Amycolatopsis dongchuanensis]|uniref:DUF4188 domain-containing protein n=1 Tax=Amycolatopsis dongchuanensis TaxID=1070866 RepID=A0ABP9QQ36_9PSEU
MSEIFPGRWTARLDSGSPDDTGVVLFLIGMRVNKWWRVDQYVWVFLAMARMLRHLAEHPEAGMIRARNWLGRTTMQVGYWRSLEHLVAFAADNDAPHAPAWRRYYRRASQSGAVGVWHETYLVGPGSFEAIYANMPLFGLAEAVGHAKVDRTTSSSRQRVARGRASRRAAEAHAAR